MANDASDRTFAPACAGANRTREVFDVHVRRLLNASSSASRLTTAPSECATTTTASYWRVGDLTNVVVVSEKRPTGSVNNLSRNWTKLSALGRARLRRASYP